MWVKVLDDNVFAIIKSYCIFHSFVFNMVSFRGKNKKPGPHPDWSPLGVKFKISDEHPSPFFYYTLPRKTCQGKLPSVNEA